MLHAYAVGRTPHRKGGAEKIVKIPRTVIGRGIVINVIVITTALSIMILTTREI